MSSDVYMYASATVLHVRVCFGGLCARSRLTPDLGVFAGQRLRGRAGGVSASGSSFACGPCRSSSRRTLSFRDHSRDQGGSSSSDGLLMGVREEGVIRR